MNLKARLIVKMVVGVKTLELYEWDFIEDYFNYICESQINGNYSQMKSLYKKLSLEQQKYFWEWVDRCDIKNIKIGDFI